MFSGCARIAESRGGAWADVHLPPSPVDEWSMLTADRAAAALLAAVGASALDVIGMKVGRPAAPGAIARERVLARSARVLLNAVRASEASPRRPSEPRASAL